MAVAKRLTLTLPVHHQLLAGPTGLNLLSTLVNGQDAEIHQAAALSIMEPSISSITRHPIASKEGFYKAERDWIVSLCTSAEM